MDKEFDEDEGEDEELGNYTPLDDFIRDEDRDEEEGEDPYEEGLMPCLFD